MNSAHTIMTALEVIGVLAFALSGLFVARQQRLDAEKIEEDAKAAVAAALGTAEGGQADGLGMVTFFEQSRAGFDQKRLQAEQPALFAKYQTTSRYRVMRLKKAK